ncbi:MAG: hypothetical protein CL466_03350 [Acidimicrobiaceae bacterium]|nr:hypothetical protein [Acidimicrobiaceae bacterium]
MLASLPEMRTTQVSALVGLAAVQMAACGSSEDLRPMLESELPTTTGIIVYSETGDDPKYVDMYFEAERKWPELTPDQWAQAATHMVDGGTWEEVTKFMVPTTTTGG